MTRRPATLVLADGTVFAGEVAGFEPEAGVATGELVFNTAMSGYQEVLTDPSYAGQVIAFTYPHIGNYGVTPLDEESPRPACRGLVVRDLAEVPSNWRSTATLESFLVDHGIPAITGVDTRRLTRHLREAGAVGCAFGPATREQLEAAAADARTTDGCDLATGVTCTSPYVMGSGTTHVVAIDYGIKATIVRELASRFRVTVVPATSTAATIRELSPAGIFLSNGPGDPSALSAQRAVVASLLGDIPIFGICLGQQVLAEALGARTYKLAFGHHGSNHPVQHLGSGRVEVTAQNHNYAVDRDSLGDMRVTHVNLNDGVVEGFCAPDARAFCVQYHPEAGPGPHDARYLFDVFEALCAGRGMEGL
ncbi:MAG TPA: glutamine-hydrolyzing carbamoyl-phosphate synthase small subunit [Acidimicrobiales bacterium]|jgi:carbamoyl-phosphate synthase small subunit